MNKEDLIYYKFFAPVILLFPILLSIYMLRGGPVCDSERSMKAAFIKGVILRRYQDPTNHGEPAFDVRDFKTNEVQKILLRNEQNNIYYRVISGDTILKEVNTLSFKIKNEGQVEEMQFGYDCN